VTNVLEVRNLSVRFPARDGAALAVRDISFDLPVGGSVALLGESGSGKTVTARALMGILDDNAQVSGTATYAGRDLLTADERTLRRLRGQEIAMVFQDALSALNPCFTVGWQVAEVFRLHGKVSRSKAKKLALDALKRVGIPDAERRFDDYPHQFSGGMRQRVLIASALAMNPRILIADEPTTALDVTVQAQVLELIRSIHEEHHMALVLISHDLGVVAEVTERVVVMYAGLVMEEGDVDQVYDTPRHPYTRALLASAPSAQPDSDRLLSIEGSPPPAASAVTGCPFHPRCPVAMDVCATTVPPTVVVADGHEVRCHLVAQEESAVAGERSRRG
jgi:oligopeptide transport system ATP-binding protein